VFPNDTQKDSRDLNKLVVVVIPSSAPKAKIAMPTPGMNVSVSGAIQQVK
jgi:hypothetical protein